MPELAWLTDAASPATIVPKDCIDLAIGSITGNGNGGVGRIGFHDWINAHRMHTVVVVGICTDICVLDPVLGMMSARNHAVPRLMTTGGAEATTMLPHLESIVVYAPGCATYDLPAPVAAERGLPPQAIHDAGIAHHIGLWLMQSRGATIADRIVWG